MTQPIHLALEGTKAFFTTRIFVEKAHEATLGFLGVVAGAGRG